MGSTAAERQLKSLSSVCCVNYILIEFFRLLVLMLYLMLHITFVIGTIQYSVVAKCVVVGGASDDDDDWRVGTTLQ